ncbi:hypothetical protein ACWDUL_21270 [Nocardia niigatensis]
MRDATRTTRVKAALRAGEVEILSCRSERPGCTRLRVDNCAADRAAELVRAAGFTEARVMSGPIVTEIDIRA